MARRSWSDDEVGTIADTMDMTTLEVAERLNRTTSQISYMRNRIKGGWSRKYQPWTEEEDSTIIANGGKLTGEQLANLLPGRSVNAVVERKRKLGVKGAKPMSLNPYAPSGRRVIARTCLGCGLLLPAKAFWDMKYKQCRDCESGHDKVARSKSGPSKRDTWYADIAQKVTLANASASGNEYTESDYEILRDPEKTVLAKALALGRTYRGASNALRRMGFQSRNWKPGSSKNEQWIINNPNLTMAAQITASVRSEVEAQGIEWQWDWDDDLEGAA